MQRTFYVKALWDDEVNRWISESDIRGLVIETATLEEFEQVIQEHAADLILSNHYQSEDFANTPLKELVPTILWQKPERMPLSA